MKSTLLHIYLAHRDGVSSDEEGASRAHGEQLQLQRVQLLLLCLMGPH